MAEAFLENIQNGYGNSDVTDPINIIASYNLNSNIFLKDVSYFNNDKIFALGFAAYSKSLSFTSSSLDINLPELKYFNRWGLPYLGSKIKNLYLPKLKCLGGMDYDNGLLQGAYNIENINLDNIKILATHTFYDTNFPHLSSLNLNNCIMIGDCALSFGASNLSEILLNNLEYIAANNVHNNATRLYLPNLKYIDGSKYYREYHVGQGIYFELSYIYFGKVENLRPTIFSAGYNSNNYISTNLFYEMGNVAIYMPELTDMYSMTRVFGYSITTIDKKYISMPKLEKMFNVSEAFMYTGLSVISFPKLRYITNGWSTFYIYDNIVSEINLPELEFIENTYNTFYFTYANNSKITKVNMPKLRRITGHNLFNENVLLSELNLPELRYVSSYTKLISVYGNYNVSIYHFKRLYIPKLKVIPADFLNKNFGLQVVDIHGCELIDNYAFASCSNIESIKALKCSYIGEYAFSNCQGLKNAQFPNVENINNYAFYNTSLRYVDFTKCKNIGSWAFGLAQLGICNFDNVESINSSAFNGCKYLGFKWHSCVNNKPIESEYIDKSYVTVACKSLYINSYYGYDYYMYYTFDGYRYSSDGLWYNGGGAPLLSVEVTDWIDINDPPTTIAFPKCTLFNNPFGGPYYGIKNIFLPECLSFTITGGSSNSNYRNWFPNLDMISIPKAIYVNCSDLSIKTLVADGITDGGNFIFSGSYNARVDNLYLRGLSSSLHLLLSNVIKNIYAPNVTYYIGHFYSCSFLEHADLHNTEYIYKSYSAFADCINLKSVDLTNIKYIGIYSFGTSEGVNFINCNNLSSLYFEKITNIFMERHYKGMSAYYSSNSFSPYTLFPDNLKTLTFNVSSSFYITIGGSNVWQPYTNYWYDDICFYSSNAYRCISSHITDWVFSASYFSRINSITAFDYTSFVKSWFTYSTDRRYYVNSSNSSSAYPENKVPAEYNMPKISFSISSYYSKCEWFAKFYKAYWTYSIIYSGIRSYYRYTSHVLGERYARKPANTNMATEVSTNDYEEYIKKLAFKMMFGEGRPYIFVPQSLYSYYENTFLNAMDTLTMMRDDPMN